MTTAFHSKGPTSDGGPYVGHAHFWERAMSRGQFIRTAAGAGAAALSSGLWMPSLAHAAASSTVLPRPIPGGTQLALLAGGPSTATEVFHFFFPGLGVENSTITDFKGLIAAARILGKGTGQGGRLSGPTTLFFDADFRVMQGHYVGVDGEHHRGTFNLL